jgi:hypothetical protein
MAGGAGHCRGGTDGLFSWIKARYPQAVEGHSVDSMRALRGRIAAQFPERCHDLTFLRRPRSRRAVQRGRFLGGAGR